MTFQNIHDDVFTWFKDESMIERSDIIYDE